MIKEIYLHNFKKFKDKRIAIATDEVTLIVGSNNSGKSTIIQALAVWEFCKLVLTQERGDGSLFKNYSKQGVGINTDEFLPMAIPSLKHLWTNLKPQKTAQEKDGYTLRIGCKWDTDSKSDLYLEIGLSLTNERLYIKMTQSNIDISDAIPRIAFMPTFAGILEKEQKVTMADRRKQIGKGLAGSVIRNLIYELYEENSRSRDRYKGNRKKIKSSDLKKLREEDPFEILQAELRKVFSTELRVKSYNELYNTHIEIDCFIVTYDEHTKRYKKPANYNERDIMVQGNGFLQWLSVFCLALNPNYDILLLDEPDAHLHNTLQKELMITIETISQQKKKQVFIATHSSKLIKETHYNRILSSDSGKYLSEDIQKMDIMLGLGGTYLPYIDQAKMHKKIVFFEGKSDYYLLQEWAKILKKKMPNVCIIYCTDSHKERKRIFLFLKEQIPDLVAISIRDRDTEHVNTVKKNLKSDCSIVDFTALTWKRTNIENYLLCPVPIATAANVSEEEVKHCFTEMCIVIPTLEKFIEHDAPEALLTIDGKTMLENLMKRLNFIKFDVISNMTTEYICDDIKTVFKYFEDLM